MKGAGLHEAQLPEIINTEKTPIQFPAAPPASVSVEKKAARTRPQKRMEIGLSQLIDLRAARIFCTALLFFALLAFLYLARHTLFAFVLAIFFAYLFEPPVSWAQRYVGTRGRAIALFYGVLVICAVFGGPSVAKQGEKVIESAPALIERLSERGAAPLAGQEHNWSARLQAKLGRYLAEHRSTIEGIAQRISDRAIGVIRSVWRIILVPILAAFFLKDGRQLARMIQKLPRSKTQKQFVRQMLGDINKMLARYIRAQLTLASIAMVAYLTGLSLLHVPDARALGITAGALEFIPVVGPLSAAILIVGVSFLTSYTHLVFLLLFLAAWRLLQDYVNAPLIAGRTMRLHPLAIVFGVLAGGEVGGVLGVFLAIPVMATVSIIWKDCRRYTRTRTTHGEAIPDSP